jgi:hypothetical protein
MPSSLRVLCISASSSSLATKFSISETSDRLNPIEKLSAFPRAVYYQTLNQYIDHGDLPDLTLSSPSQCDLIIPAASLVIIRKCPDTVLYPLSSLEANLTILIWSAWMTIGSPSAAPGTIADARGTT